MEITVGDELLELKRSLRGKTICLRSDAAFSDSDLRPELAKRVVWNNTPVETDAIDAVPHAYTIERTEKKRGCGPRNRTQDLEFCSSNRFDVC